MALQELEFTLDGGGGATIAKEWQHTGVVGSGDMEVLLERKDLGGNVAVRVVTPVKGFEHVWRRVLADFVEENGLRDLSIEINDNNATPFIVSIRMAQALSEAGKEGAE